MTKRGPGPESGQMTLIGLSTEKTAAASKDPSASEDIAIVPLAIPLLSRPGAISGAHPLRDAYGLPRKARVVVRES